MTDPIKALIAAFDAVYDAYIESDFIVSPMDKHFKAGFEAIAAIAAAEARPEPKPSHTEQCVANVAAWPEWKRKAAGLPVEPAAEPSDPVAIHLQAADDFRFNKTTDDWQELTMMSLRDAIKALAREVRK